MAPDSYCRNDNNVKTHENSNPDRHAPHARKHANGLPVDTRALAWYTGTRHDDTHERGATMTANLTDSAEDEDKIPYDMSTFRNWAKHLKQQISQMDEQVSIAYATAQTVSTHVNECTSRISELERKLDKNTTSPTLPDSNGFWRDNDGDIWAYDGDPDNQPRLIFAAAFQEVCETPTDITANWAALEDYAPFTKISNPFTTGDNNADR